MQFFCDKGTNRPGTNRPYMYTLEAIDMLSDAHTRMLLYYLWVSDQLVNIKEIVLGQIYC